jgi:hypothetical protein
MEELERGIVFRLATLKESFPPDSPRLHVSHFDLSENDKRDGERRGRSPLLSVFDGESTLVEQEALIRGVEADSASFGVRVEHVRRVQVTGLSRSLRVLRDPLEPPACDFPGAEGHCGIEGLDRRPGEEKRLYREVRVLLADASFRYQDGMR